MPTRFLKFPSPATSLWSNAFIVAIGLAVAPLSASLAQDGPGVIMGNSEIGPRMSTADDMRALAAQQGSIRVIVGLGMEFKSEGQLDAAAAGAQRATISARQDSMLSRLAGPEAVTRFETIPFVAMTLTPQDLDRVLGMAGVSSVELDIPVPPSLSESTDLVDAPQLWRQGAAGSGTSVAILDTGVRTDHNAFRTRSGRKIVASACFSSTVSGQSTSLCPNGRDRMVQSRQARAGRDCDTSISGCGHGTHVAATAAGRMGRDHDGMARDADIVAIQVFSEFSSSGSCGFAPAPCVLSYTSDQVRGLEQVMKWRDRFSIASANMSLGGGSFDRPCDDQNPSRTAIIENLRSVGIATVIASGNSSFRGSVGAPSCVSAAITVGSTTKQDELSGFSNHAPMVDLLAPGSDISAANADGGRNALISLSGTSMATPHVAGAFAMLRSHRPAASVDAIERALVCSGVTVSENNTPKPRISMVAARAYLDNPDTRRRWSFRTNGQVNQWSDVRGNWRKAGNRMLVSGGRSAGWKVAQAPFCADNIRVDATMEREDPTQPGSDSWATGLAISGETDSDGGLSGLYFLYYPQDDSLSAAIWEFENFDADSNSGEFNSLCFNSDVLTNIDAHGKLRLRVIKRGNDLTFLINGTEVCSGTTDARFTNGHLKTVMFAPDVRTRNHVLKVYNVSATALGGPKGWEQQNTIAGPASKGPSVTTVPSGIVGPASVAAVVN